MSLDTSKLENVRKRGDKATARCPACGQAGHDQKGEHLFIYADGRFGCVVYPGDSTDANEHRKRIFALCGDREIKPLIVRSPNVGRLGRVNQSQSAGQPLKTGLLGRLGRVFETHLEREREPTDRENRNTDEHQRNDCEKGVLAVLGHSKAVPHRPLTDQYILQDRDGDYVEKVESGTTETIKMHFTFTKDIAKARRFSYDDLWSPLATTSIGGEFTHGFGGGRAIKMTPFQATSRGVPMTVRANIRSDQQAQSGGAQPATKPGDSKNENETSG